MHMRIIMIKVLYVVAGGQKSFAHVQKVYWEVEKVPPGKKTRWHVPALL